MTRSNPDPDGEGRVVEKMSQGEKGVINLYGSYGHFSNAYGVPL